VTHSLTSLLERQVTLKIQNTTYTQKYKIQSKKYKNMTQKYKNNAQKCVRNTKMATTTIIHDPNPRAQ